MRLRPLVTLFAALSMLLHAAAIIRHHTVMVRAEIQYQDLAHSFSHMCLPGATQDEAPTIPRPTNAEFGCPICAGVAPLFVLSTTTFSLALGESVTLDQPAVLTSPIFAILKWLQPPARAPPPQLA